jgi:hypothetical protein
VERLEEMTLPAPVVVMGTGADTAALTPTVDTFRTNLGGSNNGASAGSTVFTGRREINWDGVPDTLASPNTMPPDFFNTTVRRGAVFATPAPGSGFQVSADATNPSNTPVRFGNLNPTYSAIFTTFSPERLFTPIGNNVMDTTFFVPGTSTPATVNGFGAVFTDVDDANTTSLQFFDPSNNSLGTFFAPTLSDGLSFLGVSFDAGERVSRVRITTGTTAPGPDDRPPATDIVVMDDFLYGEPLANGGTFEVLPSSASTTDGTAAITVERFGDTTNAATVRLSTSNGTATAGRNYIATSALVTFNPGDTMMTVRVPILNNPVPGGVATVNLTLSNPTGNSTIGTEGTAALLIRDNQALPQYLLLVDGTELVRGTTTTSITGLQSGERLVGIDFRPATGQLYGVGNSSRLYTIDPATGAATQVGSGTFAVALSGADFGVDFNPVADRLRVVSDSGQNLRIDPNTGAVVDGDPNTSGVQPDTNLAYAAGDADAGKPPNDVALAYSDNFPGTATTTLYGIDTNLGILVQQGSPGGSPTSPNTGTLFTVGSLGLPTVVQVGTNTVPGIAGEAGFDISSGGVALAVLRLRTPLLSQDNTNVYVIDLNSGTPVQIDNLNSLLGTGGQVLGLAAIPPVTIQFSAPTFSVSEAGGTAAITVTRTGSTGTSTVTFSTSGGTATAGPAVVPSIFFPPPAVTGSFPATTQTVTFNPGVMSVTINLPIRDNGRADGNRTVNLALTNPANATLGTQSTAVLNITDDDSSQTQNQRFVAQVYFDLLGRAVDPMGLTMWTDALANGTSRVDVVRAIEASDEFLVKTIQEIYQTLLHRAADPGGLSTFLAMLHSGETIQQVETAVAGSQEYFQVRGGGTQVGFIQALFQDALGRSISAQDAAAFGSAPPSQIAATVFGSPEYDGALVNNFYQRFLNRGPDGGGFLGFTEDLSLRNKRIEDVIAGIVGSQEYFGGV